MRVLIVNSGMYVYGGAELVIVKLANYMANKGIENALLTTGILPEIKKNFVKTKIIVKKPIIPFNISGFNQFFALNREVRRNLNNFDIINVHNYPAELSIFPNRKPVVWMCNEPLPYLLLKLKAPPLSKLKNKALFNFDKFVVKNYIGCSVVADKFNADRFQVIFGFKPEIIHYGVDYEFFSNGDKRNTLEELGIFHDFVILHVGMLTPFKNQMESIKTIEVLKNKVPNIKLILAGWAEGEYGCKLKNYVKNKNLEKNVIFTGHIDRTRLRDLYHACAVLLHPVGPQGGWLSPFEALSAKTPIVVSTEMTASDIIKREKIGIVTKDYITAIWDIYQNPDKYRQMTELGQLWVKRYLSWENFCEQMINLFYAAAEEKN